MNFRPELAAKVMDGTKTETRRAVYEHLGQEHARDLLVLCGGCHQGFHDRRWLAEP